MLAASAPVAQNSGTGPAVTPAAWVEVMDEQFHYADRVASTTGVTRTVNAPVKDVANNPVVPSRGGTTASDQYISYCSVQQVDGVFHMLHYGSQIGGSTPYAHYLTSTDGLAWTKPNLGRVAYAGNTNNNIVQVGIFSSARWVPEISKWVLTTEDYSAGSGLRIYTADVAQGPYTLQKALTAVGYFEGKEVIRRPDGRWVGYFSSNQSSNLRRLSAFLSDTTDMTGTWTQYNYVIPIADAAYNDQKYSLGVERVGDVYLGFVILYDSTVREGIMRMDLWKSKTAVNDWEKVSENFIPLGTSGQVDDEMIVQGSRLTVDDQTWHIYYVACPYGHEAALTQYDRELSRASIGRGRIVQYSGSGTVTTTNQTVLSGAYTEARLLVNADATGGSLDIELRDSGGTPLVGYTAADFDTITSNVYDFAPTWNGGPFPAETTLSMVFTLTNASLHGYRIEHRESGDQSTLQELIDNAADGTLGSPTVIDCQGRTFYTEETTRITGRNHLTLSNCTIISTTDGSRATPWVVLNWPRTRSHLRVDGDSSYITISGVTIHGPHAGAGTADAAYVVALEAQHAFDIDDGSTYVTVQNCNADHVYGDFVYIRANNTTVTGCAFDSNGRQGISIVNASDVIVSGCTMTNVRRAMFDLEPNTISDVCDNVHIENNVTYASRLNWMSSGGQGSNVTNIVVTGNTMLADTIDLGGHVDILTPVGQRRGPWTFTNNVIRPSGSPNPGLRFKYIDGLTFTGNTIICPVARSMTGVELTDCTAYTTTGNTFVGTAVDISIV